METVIEIDDQSCGMENAADLHALQTWQRAMGGLALSGGM